MVNVNLFGSAAGQVSTRQVNTESVHPHRLKPAVGSSQCCQRFRYSRVTNINTADLFTKLNIFVLT